jgi:HAMP domain-containing protein
MKALFFIGFLNLAALAVFYWSIRTMSQAQIDQIKALTAQVVKAKGEIVGKIQQLEDTINNGGDEAAVQAALDELKAAVQSVDDVVPDAAPTSDGSAAPAPTAP